MSRRERIILLVMVAVIVYGVYDLFLAPGGTAPTVRTPVDLKSLEQLVATVTADLKKDVLTTTDDYIIRRAESEWTTDPFKPGDTTVEDTPADTEATEIAVRSETLTPSPKAFVYSGFATMGEEKVAIINGLEYQMGDALGDGPYVVKDISAARVVLENSKQSETLTIPFQGEGSN